MVGVEAALALVVEAGAEEEVGLEVGVEEEGIQTLTPTNRE